MGEPQTVGGKEIAARRAKADAGKDKSRKVWCAYDDNDYVLFGAELTALRYATDHHMSCVAVVYGVPLKEQIT